MSFGEVTSASKGPQWMARVAPSMLCVSLVFFSSGCGSESTGTSDGSSASTSANTTAGTTGTTTGVAPNGVSATTTVGTVGTSSTSSAGAVGTTAGVGGTTAGAGGTTAGGVTQGSTAGGASAGGASTNTGVGGTGGATAGTGVGGGTTAAGGTGSVEACAFECVDQCANWGGTEQPGVCEAAQQCCEGAIIPADNPLAHLIPSAQTVGLLLANRFSQQALAFSSVANLPGDGYKTACEWYGSLAVASLTSSQDLLDSLVSKFDPFKNDFVQAMTGGEAHVDRYIFGMVPLEIYLQTDDESYLPLGTQTADTQQTTNQTRDAIDDMFMMTGLQLQAYRATADVKYMNFMAETMVDYLGAQQDNGLFFHNVTEARVHWGRGNGWFAAGMAEIMRDLPMEHADYQTIEDGYKSMMEGLLPYQSDNGLWYQVLNLPDDASNWEESSGSAMFTYAMVAGVRRGVLDAATYVPVIEAAWQGLQGKISGQGDVSDICVGTWYHGTPQEYMALTRLTGDGHGQAPILWVAAELLR